MTLSPPGVVSAPVVPSVVVPSVVVVMGVSGSGKTTVGALLAGRLGWEFEDGDDFHPPANVAKMSAGTPLTDEDRWPWLHTVAAWIDAVRATGRHGVVTCSGLKKAYRDILVGDRPDVRLVYLHGSRETVGRRQAARVNHFMPASLVDSQFATLQEPGADEGALIVSVEPRPGEIVDTIATTLGLVTPAPTPPPPPAPSSSQDDGKRAAAEAAVAEVEDGMVVGLGTGSTAAFAVAALGRRVAEGLRIIGVPTSEKTHAQAAALNIPLATLEQQPALDLTIDGADEVDEASLVLIKGLGGALLREKLVAASSRRMTVIVDPSKIVSRLGAAKVPVPVEVVRFGVAATLARLTQAGVTPTLRTAHGGEPFVTDNGNHIADCAVPGGITDPADLHARLKALPGVVETGLFVGMATRIAIGSPGGPRFLPRASEP